MGESWGVCWQDLEKISRVETEPQGITYFEKSAFASGIEHTWNPASNLSRWYNWNRVQWRHMSVVAFQIIGNPSVCSIFECIFSLIKFRAFLQKTTALWPRGDKAKFRADNVYD